MYFFVPCLLRDGENEELKLYIVNMYQKGVYPLFHDASSKKRVLSRFDLANL